MTDYTLRRCIKKRGWYIRGLRLLRKSEKTHLVRDVWARVGDVAPRLREDALVIVAIEQSVLGLAAVLAPSLAARSRSAAARNFVRFETGLLEDDEEATLGERCSSLGHMGLYRQHCWVRWVLHGRVGVRGGHLAGFRCGEWAGWALGGSGWSGRTVVMCVFQNCDGPRTIDGLGPGPFFVHLHHWSWAVLVVVVVVIAVVGVLLSVVVAVNRAFLTASLHGSLSRRRFRTRWWNNIHILVFSGVEEIVWVAGVVGVHRTRVTPATGGDRGSGCSGDGHVVFWGECTNKVWDYKALKPWTREAERK